MRKVAKPCEGPGCDVRKAPYRMVADQFLCGGCFEAWRTAHLQRVALATLGIEETQEDEAW